MRDVQATVSEFDQTTGAGAVIFDDGHISTFSANAFANSGLRILRPGQRVRLEMDGADIVALTIHTLSFPRDTR